MTNSIESSRHSAAWTVIGSDEIACPWSPVEGAHERASCEFGWIRSVVPATPRHPAACARPRIGLDSGWASCPRWADLRAGCRTRCSAVGPASDRAAAEWPLWRWPPVPSTNGHPRECRAWGKVALVGLDLDFRCCHPELATASKVDAVGLAAAAACASPSPDPGDDGAKAKRMAQLASMPDRSVCPGHMRLPRCSSTAPGCSRPSASIVPEVRFGVP